MIICPKCNFENENKNTFCSNCKSLLISLENVESSSEYITKDTDITSKKELICNTVCKYKDKLLKSYSVWKVIKFNEYPIEKKESLLKIDSNFYYEDFACVFSIPNPLNLFQLSPKGDYGLFFMVSGFYLRAADQLKSFTYIKYNQIKDCSINKNVLRINLTKSVDGFLLKQDYIEIAEYDPFDLSQLLMELKEIDNDNPVDYLITPNISRTKGITNENSRKLFLKAQERGYIRSSREYESKLRKQADYFLDAKNEWLDKRNEYELLINDYQLAIKELEDKLINEESSELRIRLKNAKDYLSKLLSLKNILNKG